MLSLQPPYLLAGNLVIFRDDKDITTFYYACQQPSISVGENGGRTISAYAIIPESGVGATSDILEAGLYLDVELSATKEELDEATKEIQKYFGVHPNVFSPAPLHSGTVRFTMAQSGEEPEKSEWYVTSGVQPSLLGSNKASLMVRTTGDNAKLLIASVDAGSVPACVYYELNLLGSTPIYHASLEADKSLIYHHLEEMKKDNFVFYSDEISQAIDELQDSKALKIQVEELDSDIKAEAMRTLLNDLKSKVIEEFFQPAEFYSDQKESQNQEGSIIEKLFGTDVVGLVKEPMFGRQFTRKKVDQIQSAKIKIDLSQSNAKTYTYCPQSLLKTMAERAGVNLSEIIEWYNLGDLPEKSQEVRVRVSPDAFESANLKSIEVFCRVVNSDTCEVTEEVALPPFETSNKDLTSVFNYHRQRGVNYHYEYQVILKLNSGTDKLPTLLKSPWTQQKSPYIYINPAVYFTDYELNVYLEDRAIFDHAQMVQMVVTAVIGEEEVLSRTYLFKDDVFDSKSFSIVADRNADLHYHIQLTYYLANSPEQVMEYDVKETLFFVPNPFENKWSVDIRCKVDWEKYERIYLNTCIVDPDREDPIENRFPFTPDMTEQKLSVACGLKTPKQTFDYLIQWFPADGERYLKSGWHSFKGDFLVLREKDFVPTRVLRVQLDEELDFKKWEIQYVEVKLRFADGAETEPQNLCPETQQLKFIHRVADNEPSTYSYQYKLKFPGHTKSSGWMTSDSDNLLVTIDKELL
jgi:hypothetical protein